MQYAYIDVQTGINRELFCSTEGSCIDQSYALTQGMVSVVAQKPEVSLRSVMIMWEISVGGRF